MRVSQGIYETAGPDMTHYDTKPVGTAAGSNSLLGNHKNETFQDDFFDLGPVWATLTLVSFAVHFSCCDAECSEARSYERLISRIRNVIETFSTYKED